MKDLDIKDENQYFHVVNLNKSFGGLSAVCNLTFGLERNRITSLIGPNGAGKTTTFNLISGYLWPDRGQIFFKGQEITGLGPHQIVQLGIARTFQDLRLLYKLTVIENILLGFQNRKGERLFNALVSGRVLTREDKEDFGKAKDLLQLIELDNKDHELVENLSYGEQKLLALGRILATDAELLMLDEPASGLPLGTVDRMLELIHGLIKKGKTLLIVEHNMEAVMDISDWIVVLNFGEVIASGTPDEIQKNEEVIRVYLGL
jgi:branched-chain amino acid transport system ATP-binding protein